MKQYGGRGGRHAIVAALAGRLVERRPGARDHDAAMGPGNIDGSIRTFLIHDRHLAGDSLRLDGLQQLADVPLLVIGWDDDRHLGRVVHSVEAIMPARSACAERSSEKVWLQARAPAPRRCRNDGSTTSRRIAAAS